MKASTLKWYKGLILNEIERCNAKNRILIGITFTENVDNKIPACIKIQFLPHDDIDKLLEKMYEISSDAMNYLFLVKEITIKIEEIWK